MSINMIKKLISHGMIVVMLVSSFFMVDFSLADESSAMEKVGKVTASKIYVRSGAGSSYKKLGSYKKGTYKIIRGSKKDSSGVTWYKVKYGSKTGYVSSKYVSNVKVSITKLNNKVGKVNVSSGSLTIRSGPGKIYSNLGSLKKGKTFAITGKAKDVYGKYWYRFTYNDAEAYVLSTYVKVSDAQATSSETAESSSAASSTTKATTTTTTTASTSATKESSTTATTKSTTTTSSSSSSGGSATYTIGTITTSSSSLNVRTGPGTSYSVLGTIAKGSVITITGSKKDSDGTVWYSYEYSSSKTGYVSSAYVTTSKVTSDGSFESYLNQQGFPESYKAGLRTLHAAHPNWTFKAVNVGCSWTTALNAETKNVGTNLVSPSLPTSYRSKEKGSYNSSTKTYTKFDGSWYAASKTVVAYYMDPRNFLNENGIYQFMTHQYDSSSQSTTTVKAVVKGSFMETRATGNSTYPTYAALINAAGKAAGVNPNVVAAMIVQEQGTKGTSGLISGKYSGYTGYYNFFNIGAYTTSTMSAVQRGLWYAKQSGSYGRPWNSVYKSIKGGALFYGTNYVQKNQDTYYYKKFNVKNGTTAISTHQYMTNVSAAASEGKLLKSAFSTNSSYSAIIEIPVYSSMPADACPLP